MKKKILTAILIFLMIVIIYLVTQFSFLENTVRVPYGNLRNIGSASCYIAFNVEHNDSIYHVILPNDFAAWTVKRKSAFHRYFYSLYMNEIIRHNLNVSLNDSLFSEVKYNVVEDQILRQFENHDIYNDTIIIDKENRLSNALSQKEHNAIIYLLLRNGINCCAQDMSGDVIVSVGTRE